MPEKTTVPYGQGVISWDRPDDVVLPRPKGGRPARCTPEEALCRPVGAPSLASTAQGARKAVIVVPDATRLWENIPAMGSAVRRELGGDMAVTWLVGAGLHRSPTTREMETIFGAAPRPEDRVLWADHEKAVDTGLRTSRGTPVTLAPEALDADVLVLVGGIVYHDLAGFSGGRKALLPGISGRTSVQKNHGYAIEGGVAGLRPNVGRIEGNPTAEDMGEYAALLAERKKIFILNVIPDETGSPYCYVAGDLAQAWRRGVELATALQTLYVPEKAALLVVSSGGYPYDLDLYQATKSVSATLGALRPGGGFILCATLEDGMGPGSFASDFPLALRDQEALVRQLGENFTIPGFIALKIAHDMERHPSGLVTPREGTPFPGGTYPSLQDALDAVVPRVPEGPVVYVEAGSCIFLKVEE